MNLITFCNKIIEYCFYTLFLLIPLVFTSSTSELFEFNKMWLTFGLTIVIVTTWIIKMLAQKQLRIQRTPLDIPILLFLASQFISTIFSLDFHVSWWGYYSRFNGGFLSILSYILLYYAFVSNFNLSEVWGGSGGKASGSAHLAKQGALTERKLLTGPPTLKVVKRLLWVSLLSGIIVALWGFPSHFGYDPTCLLFRGTLDVSCWTESFQPKVRIFSTLGQPNWLAAYLSILLPVTIALFIKSITPPPQQFAKNNSQKPSLSQTNITLAICFLLLMSLFYLDLLYTGSQSGYVGFLGGLAVFIGVYFFRQKKLTKAIGISILLLLVLTFFTGQPIPSLNKFTFRGINEYITAKKVQESHPKATVPSAPATHVFPGELGGTDSGQIRKIVWKGALDIWKHTPLFGTGVETFAFAYYQYRPPEHNLTSEWDYLYNKAHNEYLNYLATTGAFGLGTYLTLIGLFLYIALKDLLSTKSETSPHNTSFLWSLALVAGFISILISNFFGFSVVIINVYLFFIPAFFFILRDKLNPQKQFTFPSQNVNQQSVPAKSVPLNAFQWMTMIGLSLVACYWILVLVWYWQADQAYSLGSNLDKLQQYQQAYPSLKESVTLRSDEPVFLDELAVNNAILATAFAYQKDATSAAQLAQESIRMSDKITTEHPNNIMFWKSRVRILYALSQIQPSVLPVALEAIKKAHELAPTDAKVYYNLGLLYGQTQDYPHAIEALSKTVELKPDYREAYYALGLFYHELAVDKNGTVTKPDMQEKAVQQMDYILKNLSPNDKQVKDTLSTWGVQQ